MTGIEVFREGDMVTIRVSGTGFLYNMVRIISGTLIEIGNGQYPPERMQKILDAKARSAAGPTGRGFTMYIHRRSSQHSAKLTVNCD